MDTSRPPRHGDPTDAAESDLDTRTIGSGSAITALFAAAQAALFLVDPDGRVIAFNAMAAERAERHFQRPLSTGDRIIEFVPAESRNDFASHFERCLEGSSAECVHQLTTPSQPPTWYRLSVRPVKTPDGKNLGAAFTALDVTAEQEHAQARIALEQQLGATHRLEGLGRLASGVAHDVNNVLSVVIGATELSLGLATRDPKLTNHLGEILRAAIHGSELTQQLLAFGRTHASDRERVDLRRTVSDMTPLLERILGERIALRVTAGDVPCRARIDATQLEQVVMNLIVNARDAMPEGGVVGIDVDIAAGAIASLPEATACVRVSITDTGIGMDAATRSRALEPFFTTKPIGRGTGLGLAVVQEIVEQSKGSLRIESARGVGTRVTVFVPLGDEGAAMPEADPQDSVQPRRAVHDVQPDSPESSLRRVHESLDRLEREHDDDPR